MLGLLAKYLLVYESDPAHDLKTALKALIKDPEYARLVAELGLTGRSRYGLKSENFYHPLTCFLRITLYRDWHPRADASRATQLKTTRFNFDGHLPADGDRGRSPYPVEDLDFSLGRCLRELQLGAVLPPAVRHRRAAQPGPAVRGGPRLVPLHLQPGRHRTRDARPGAPPIQRYWITKPFFQTTTADYLSERIDDILYAIAADPTGATVSDLKFAVSQWRDNPFKPHVIARTRPVAYQMAVVVNVHPEPDRLGRQPVPPGHPGVDHAGDAALHPRRQAARAAAARGAAAGRAADRDLQPAGGEARPVRQRAARPGEPDPRSRPPAAQRRRTASPLTLCRALLLHPAQRRTAADTGTSSPTGCFKIRNCQNIDGVERPLALFAPPIDPGALVRAAAAGLDISTILAGQGAPLPNYRFHILAQKATELTQQVSALGTALLAALEKRDAEALAGCARTRRLLCSTRTPGQARRDHGGAPAPSQALQKTRRSPRHGRTTTPAGAS